MANARELEAVTGSSHRSDHHDARQLARLARVDAALLNRSNCTAPSSRRPVRDPRAVLVEARTTLINFARHHHGASATVRYLPLLRRACSCGSAGSATSGTVAV